MIEEPIDLHGLLGAREQAVLAQLQNGNLWDPQAKATLAQAARKIALEVSRTSYTRPPEFNEATGTQRILEAHIGNMLSDYAAGRSRLEIFHAGDAGASCYLHELMTRRLERIYEMRDEAAAAHRIMDQYHMHHTTFDNIVGRIAREIIDVNRNERRALRPDRALRMLWQKERIALSGAPESGFPWWAIATLIVLLAFCVVLWLSTRTGPAPNPSEIGRPKPTQLRQP